MLGLRSASLLFAFPVLVVGVALTAPEWQAFTGQLQLAASYPGLQGIGYARRLLPDAPAPAVDPTLTVPDGSTPATNRDRTSILYFEPLERNRLVGFVYSPFRAEAFIGAVLRRLPNDLTVEVFDGDRARHDSTLYRHGAVSQAALTREQTLSTMGHRRLIRMGYPMPSNSVRDRPIRRSLSAVRQAAMNACITSEITVSVSTRRMQINYSASSSAYIAPINSKAPALA